MLAELNLVRLLRRLGSSRIVGVMSGYRVGKVIGRMRPGKANPAEHLDIGGYCSRCQEAYRIQWQMFSKIVENLDAQELIRHNIDIKIRHENICYDDRPKRVRVPEYKLKENVYSLYSHNIEQYVVLAGVRILLPKKAHQEMCRGVTIEVDMPIRKDAPFEIKEYTERTLSKIAEITQTVQPHGIGVVDQKETEWAIESKIKVIIGDPGSGIELQPGWQRKKTYYHGISIDQREAATNIATSAEKLRSEKEADAESEQMEVMEIDSEEAPQPPKVNPHSRMDMETQSNNSTTVVIGARRARAATLPILSTS